MFGLRSWWPFLWLAGSEGYGFKGMGLWFMILEPCVEQGNRGTIPDEHIL